MASMKQLWNKEPCAPEVAILAHLDNEKWLHLLPDAQWQILEPHYSPPSVAEEAMKIKCLLNSKAQSRKHWRLY